MGGTNQEVFVMKKIAIIPARSGSKGLKDKNIIDVCGKPLIAYSIEAALDSGQFERVIVSTDSEKYGQISEAYGAEVMYRGEKLSDDKATTYMVLEDLLGRVEKNIDYFVLLQPTSPMRTSVHVREAVELFEEKYDNFDFLVSVKEAELGAVLVKPIEEDGSLKHFDTDFSNYRRQTYKEYSPNGAIYIGKIDAYLQRKHFFGEKSVAYIMNAFDSVDIDNELDYEFACLCMEKRMQG
jgi:CMP-N-acetylneuraminic acid synthetase